MKNSLLKSLMVGLFLLAMPMVQYGQKVHNHSIELELEKIANPDFRYCILANIVNDSNYKYTVNEENNSVLLFPAEHWADSQFQAYFDQTMSGVQSEFDTYSHATKERQGEMFTAWKSELSEELFVLLFRLIMIENPNSKGNNQHCVDSDPFCTTDVVTFHVDGSASGVCESGPSYGCMSSYTQRPPFWFHMKIGVAGTFTIRITNSNNLDLDFCAWGPFTDPTTPCPSQLTSSKIIDCDSPYNSVQECTIPTSAQVGQYYIMVITKYSPGSTDITFQKIAGSGPGETDCGILPGIASNTGPYCVGENIMLRVNTQEGATYSWTGPGGFTSTQQNPTRPNCTLAMGGDYTCVTTVGTHSVTATTNVQVSPNPTPNFTATTVCKGQTTQFTNTTTTNPANQSMSCTWNFGDGQTSTQQSPTHTYANAGTYNVTLNVTCGNCVKTKTSSVVVNDMPVANAGPDQTINYGGTANIGTAGNSNFSYHWTPSDKVVNPNAAQTQTVSLSQSQVFTLTVTNSNGQCTDSDEVSILVNGPAMSASASATPSSICHGENTSQLRANAVGGTGNYSYSWSPAMGLSDPLAANPIASPSATTTYTCTVSDGQTTQQTSATVTVNQPEHTEITEYICPGDSYNFYGTDYSAAGDYTYQTTTPQGCQKTITLHLRHYPSYNHQATPTNAAICQGLSYNFHGQYFQTQGLHSVNLHTTHDCDSIVWLNLTVYPANDTIKDPQSICTTQTLTWHGHEYSHDGDVAYFDTVDHHGCPLVYKLELTVGDYQTPPNYDPNVFVCVPYNETPHYHWDIANRDYYQDATDTFIVEGPPNECDYLYTLNLQFLQEHYYPETQTVCDSYYWPFSGETFTTTNHQITRFEEHPFGPTQSCVDTHTLDLTVNYSTNDTIEVFNQCDQYPWQFGWHGEIDTLTDKDQQYFTKTIDTHLGCDSTVTLRLHLDYTPSFNKIYGKQWVVGGSEFQYTVERFWINLDNPKADHETTWELHDKNGNPFNKWEILPYGNGDNCYLYIYTFERDTIWLHAHTQSTGECECGSDDKELWIVCGYYGVNETIDPCSVDIYPNPNDGNMTLALDNMMGETFVRIFNLTGTLVDQFTLYNEFGHQTYTYQAGKLTPGAYFFNIINKQGILTKKVIIID